MLKLQGENVCAGVDRDEGMCNFCRSSSEGHHWENGLDLELSPTSAETMADATARARWADLVRRHHPLSPVEEALISPVSACFSVLKLPSGGQLGFRGNVINFAFDVGKVCPGAEFSFGNEMKLTRPRGSWGRAGRANVYVCPSLTGGEAVATECG